MPNEQSNSDYPLADDPATKMMAAGFERLKDEEGLTQRELANRLGYRTSVVVSHMASGRVPIPIDRAFDIANVLRLDPKRFMLAILEQRFPSANIRELLGVQFVSGGRVAAHLELLAGIELDDLPGETLSVMEQVISTVRPQRRWLSVEELALVEHLRRRFPSLKKRSLGGAELMQLERCMEAIASSEERS